jgi:filamentous hemagglutinin family protein
VPDTQWAVLRENLPAGALVVVDGSRSLAQGSLAVALIAADLELVEPNGNIGGGGAGWSIGASSAARGLP